MLMLSFLEAEGRLLDLSNYQLDQLYRYFSLYLMQAMDLNETHRKCKAILDEDQRHLESIIRRRLFDLRLDADLTKRYKLAVLWYMQTGLTDSLRSVQISKKRLDRMIDQDRKLYRAALKKVVIDSPTPSHLSELEAEIIQQLRSYTMHVVRSNARFLCQAEPGLTLDDIVAEIQAQSLVTIRWSYPFREGLYLVNTVKSNIVNKVNTYISSRTRQKNQRLIQQEDGSYSSMESFVEGAENFFDPRNESKLATFLALAERSRHRGYRRLAQFVADPSLQDEYFDFILMQYSIRAQDMSQAVRLLTRKDIRPVHALAKFLGIPSKLLRRPWRELRTCITTPLT